MASHLTNLVEVARTRILSQYRKLVLYFVPLIEQLVDEVQDLEDAAWGMYEGVQLDNAAGVMLDQYGELLQEKREGITDDEQYRALLKAKIVANVSRGRIEDLIAIVTTALDPLGTPTVTVRELPPLGAHVEVEGVTVTNPLRERVRRLLSKARGATVRLQFITRPSGTPSTGFTFSAFGGGASTGDGFAGVGPTVVGGKFRSAKAAPK